MMLPMTALYPRFTWFLFVMFLISTQVIATQESMANPERSSWDDLPPSILLVQQDQLPRVVVTWVAGGELQRYTMTLPFSAPQGGEVLGESNVMAYATLGGTRIETGAGHPKGAVIRVGLTKVVNSNAFFKGIDPFTDVTIDIRGVRFNQPVKYHEGTALMHLKYALTDLKACALPVNARNQYLLSDPNDTLGGRVQRGINATPGALDGNDDNGSAEVIVQPDDPTLVDLRVRVPFRMLRHLQDPWVSPLPGTFFEPIHLHAEAELIPVGVEPLDRDPILPELNSDLPAVQPQGDTDAID
jgi:hypothetical protein